MIGLVGVPHGDLPTDEIFWANKGIRGGPAPVRAYLPHLLDLVWKRQIDPGKVFDLTLPAVRGGRGATGPWTSDAPSRCCCSPDQRFPGSPVRARVASRCWRRSCATSSISLWPHSAAR